MYAGNQQRKYQKEYCEYVRSLPEDQVPCTYHSFADKMRYRARKDKQKKVEKKRMYEVQYQAYCKTTKDPVLYSVFYNRFKNSKRGRKAKFVTPPPIDPIVPEKKEFRTPSRFDTILQLVIRLLMTGVLTSYRVPLFTNDTPITNTVIVKVQEKVVYKTPVKKVSKPVSCANK